MEVVWEEGVKPVLCMPPVYPKYLNPELKRITRHPFVATGSAATRAISPSACHEPGQELQPALVSLLFLMASSECFGVLLPAAPVAAAEGREC